MEQYDNFLNSEQYVEFILENAAYATTCGYDVYTNRGVAAAVNDQFLFTVFLNEMVGV